MILIGQTKQDRKPRRQTGEQICHAILKLLMQHKQRGQMWVKMEDFWRLDPKPTRVYFWLNKLNGKLLVIDRSKVQRLVALHSPELEKMCNPLRLVT